jgi:hypothetical protein
MLYDTYMYGGDPQPLEESSFEGPKSGILPVVQKRGIAPPGPGTGVPQNLGGLPTSDYDRQSQESFDAFRGALGNYRGNRSALEDATAKLTEAYATPENQLNLPLLQFAMGLMKPTRSGSIFESVGQAGEAAIPGVQKQREIEQARRLGIAKAQADLARDRIAFDKGEADMQQNVWSKAGTLGQGEKNIELERRKNAAHEKYQNANIGISQQQADTAKRAQDGTIVNTARALRDEAERRGEPISWEDAISQATEMSSVKYNQPTAHMQNAEYLSKLKKSLRGLDKNDPDYQANVSDINDQIALVKKGIDVSDLDRFKSIGIQLSQAQKLLKSATDGMDRDGIAKYSAMVNDLTSEYNRLRGAANSDVPNLGPGSATSGGPPIITTPEQYNKLPSGTRYIDSNGSTATKR